MVYDILIWTTSFFSALRKESFNSDGHQFNQNQQSKQSPLILTVSLVIYRS